MVDALKNSPPASPTVGDPRDPLEPAHEDAPEPEVLELPLPEDWLIPAAAKVLHRLHRCDHVAYLVGGCVRDLMLGRYPKDFDVATSALPRDVKRAFSNCRLIGRRFRLAHIMFSDTIIEVATFRRDPTSADVDVEDIQDLPDEWLLRRLRMRSKRGLEPSVSGAHAVARAETAQAEGADPSQTDPAEESDGEEPEADQGADAELEAQDEGREEVDDDAGDGEELSATGGSSADDEESRGGEDYLIRSDNVFGTPEEDARRRDFTINGMFYDLASNRLVDWVGGLKDIEARLIRTIGEPEIRFREDPVRMLRAVKFAGALRLQVEPQTWAALQRAAPDISRAAPPRVFEELLRMLRGGASARCFSLLQEGGLLRHMLPELCEEEEPEGGTVSSELEAEAFEATSGPGPGLKGGGLRFLSALDQVDQGDLPLPNHLLLGALLLGPILEGAMALAGEARQGQTLLALDELLEALGGRLRIPRRDRERLRLVTAGLLRILERYDRPAALSGLARKSYFQEALALFAIFCLGRGQGLAEVLRLGARIQPDPELRRILKAVERALEGPGEPLSMQPWEAPAPSTSPTGPSGRKRRRRRRSSPGKKAEASPET